MRRAMKWIVASAVLPILVVSACQTATDEEGADDTNQPLAEAQVVDPGGARLWRENCIRCHTLRLPDERSDAEWDVIVHHMRVRANLTGEEARLITRFLKSAN